MGSVVCIGFFACSSLRPRASALLSFFVCRHFARKKSQRVSGPETAVISERVRREPALGGQPVTCEAVAPKSSVRPAEDRGSLVLQRRCGRRARAFFLCVGKLISSFFLAVDIPNCVFLDRLHMRLAQTLRGGSLTAG